MIEVPPMGGAALMAIGLAKLRYGHAPCHLYCGDSPMHRNTAAVKSWARGTRAYYGLIDAVTLHHANGVGVRCR